MSKQFQQRLIFSMLGILGLIICIYYSYHPFFKPFFILLNAGLISLALIEYYRLAQQKGFQPLIFLAVISSILYVVTVAVSLHYPSLVGFPSLVLIGSLFFFFLSFFKQPLSPLVNLAITVFGIAYLTLPLSCAIRINDFFLHHARPEDGRLWLGYVLLISKMTDIGAYFFGKMLGKNKLASFISPKKTIEGALGGSGLALLTSICLALLSSLYQIETFTLTLGQSIWLGLVLSILAQLGDLAESLLKRDVGVKDSSHLPGLGGILDIVDSLIFTLPFMYLALEMQWLGK